MTLLDQITALQIDGEDFSLAAVLRMLGHTGRTAFLIDAARELLIERAARERGLRISTESLQSAADAFRAERNLHGVDQTHAWLTARGWNASDLERYLELRLLRAQLIDDVASTQRIEQHFAEHRRAYDQARLAHILVAERSVAEELLAQIHDEEADFGELARRFSIDSATVRKGGELGQIERASLSPAVESAVFAANAGDIVGPIQTSRGFHLINVYAVIPGQLDQTVTEAIRKDLFDQWLDGQLQSANVTCPLFAQT